MWLVPFLLGACAVESESDRPFVARFQNRSDGWTVGVEPHGPTPGTRIAWRAPDGRSGTIDDGHSPDRPALDPERGLLAYVSGAPDGIAAIWVQRLDDGRRVQVTNVGLKRKKEGPPDGFVAVPHGDTLEFHGGKLRWTAPDGPHEVAVPTEVSP